MDPYSDNPFRVLGLWSNVSGKDASKAADRLLKWIEIGETPEVEDYLPFLEISRLDKERRQHRTKSIIGKSVEDDRVKIQILVSFAFRVYLSGTSIRDRIALAWVVRSSQYSHHCW